MKRISVLVTALVLGLGATLTGCSGDSDSTNNSDSNSSSGNTDSSGSNSGSNNESKARGTLSLVGEKTSGYALNPSVQCSIFNEDTISIAGSANNDPAVEFTFDVFGPGEAEFKFTDADGATWSPVSKVTVTVENETSVNGLTELKSSTSGDVVSASFFFECAR